MPYQQYRIIKKAAEIEEIRLRRVCISDMNAAFFGNKKHIDRLEKIHNEIEGNNINFEGDPDWKEKLMRYKR